MTEVEGAKEINLANLSGDQLVAVNKQLEMELQQLVTSFEQLNIAYNRFNASKKSLGKLTDAHEKRDVLIPVTESMYVPGTLELVDSVLVDIGTGYYVEKPRASCASFLETRMKKIREQMELVQNHVGLKRRNIESVQAFAQQRMMQAQQQAQAK